MPWLAAIFLEDALRSRRSSGSEPVGLCGKFTDDQPGARPDELGEALGVEAPAVGLDGFPAADLGVQRLGHAVQRLVAGERAHHVIAVAHEAVHGDVDELLGSGHEHLVGIAAHVEPGDLPAQQRVALGLGVAELKCLPQIAGRHVGQREELCQRQAVAVGGGQRETPRRNSYWPK